MILPEIVQKLAIKLQTTSLNVGREYFQHLFLNSLYQQKGSESLFFKGGTALRLIYGSPRFSEDLDFSSKITVRVIENILMDVLEKIEREEKIELAETKKTTFGYLLIAKVNIADILFEIKIEISLRNKRPLRGEEVLITSDFYPNYQVLSLIQEDLVKGKIDALLSRTKPRDLFDLYFILRKMWRLNLTKEQIEKIFTITEKMNDRLIFKELNLLLPKSHHLILKNFKQNLLRELERVKYRQSFKKEKNG